MYLYRAFGLTLASELRCPELRLGEGPADVAIRLAPAADAGSQQAPSGFDASPGYFDLRVPRVGQFFVARGESIAITPEPNADEESLRLFLLGTAIGALLHQRAALPLHGSAVCRDGRALLILGESGAGKSTLAAALGRHGWRLQSDDISVVNLRHGRAECEAGFPRQKMWPDMLRQLDDDPERHVPVRAGLEKRSVQIADAAFHDASAAVDTIIALSAYRGKSPVLTPVTGPPRMALLKRLTFRANLRAPLQMHLAHFEIIGRLAEQAGLWRLQRPRLGGTPAVLAEVLQSHLDSTAVPR